MAYLVLKTAHSLYGKNPAALRGDELQRVERVAARQYEIEARVLASVEAQSVVLPPATLAAALDEVRSRYLEADPYADDLAENGLSPEAYAQALERELKVEAVLERVGGRASPVSDIDVELYYHYHAEQFQRPELRRARHILVTVNPDLPENTPAEAQRRIEAIAQRLAKDPRRFEEQALKHSECPTALNGGLLGDVRRGQLFPELDQTLFELQAMQLSPALTSPLGLHLLRCDAVTPARQLQLAEVGEQIRELLFRRRKRVCQQAWLKQRQGS